MKKNKQKLIVKEQKKAIKKELTEQLTGAIRSIVTNFSDNKKTEKLIEKSTKQLVKKLFLTKIALSIDAPEITEPLAEKPLKKGKAVISKE